METTRWTAVLCVVMLACLGCGGGRHGVGVDADSKSAGFALHVWEESYLGGAPAGDFSLRTVPEDGSLTVTLSVSRARGLKALYFDLAYDDASWVPVEAAAAPALGDPQQLLTLAVLDQPGKAYFGAVLIHPAEQAGFTGDGALATLRFTRADAFTGPRMASRAVSAAPVSNGSKAPLSWDPSNNRLRWMYYNQGDYDQNGEVNISDLTPLGANFGTQSEVAGHPFCEVLLLSGVDGDGNGEINISDITPIGANLNASALGGYEIYASPNQTDYPAANDEPPSFAPLATQATPGQTPQGQRLHYLYDVQNPQANVVYWVRPIDGEGGVGTPSNMAGGNPGDCATLSLDDPPPVGSGTQVTPYIAYPGDVFHFSVHDAGANDVTHDAATVYHLGEGAPGCITTANARLEIVDGFSGYFYVWAAYQNLQANGIFWFRTPGADEVPTAILVAQLNPIGEAPLTVEVDASGSFDPDGNIVKYEIDWDGPMFGFTWFDYGNDPTQTSVYNAPMDYQCWLRVTDNDGYTATTWIMVMAYEKSSSVVQAGEPASNVVGKYCSLAEVNHQPGISYYDETISYLLYSYYVQPPAPDPAFWKTCVVDNAGIVGKGTSLVPNSTYTLPYIAYYDQTNHALKFARATTTTPVAQADWVKHTVDAGPNVGMGPSMWQVNGYPMIAYEDAGNDAIKFAQSSVLEPSSAADWTIHTVCAVSVPYSYPSLRDMGGMPAFSFCDPANFKLMYARATVPNPASASDWQVMLTDDSVAEGGSHSLDTLVTYLGGGNYEYSPMIGYFDWTNGNLRCMFGSALPAGPADFSSSFIQTLNPKAISLTGGWGKPILAFVSPVDDGLFVARTLAAEQAKNGQWYRYSLDLTRQVGDYISVADIGFGFGVAYFDEGSGDLCYMEHSEIVAP